MFGVCVFFVALLSFYAIYANLSIFGRCLFHFNLLPLFGQCIDVLVVDVVVHATCPVPEIKLSERKMETKNKTKHRNRQIMCHSIARRRQRCTIELIVARCGHRGCIRSLFLSFHFATFAHFWAHSSTKAIIASQLIIIGLSVFFFLLNSAKLLSTHCRAKGTLRFRCTFSAASESRNTAANAVASADAVSVRSV